MCYVQILGRTMSALENGYKIPNMKLTGHLCRTNLAPNVAFRGFGVPQSTFLMEYIVDHVASTLHVDPESVCLYSCVIVAFLYGGLNSWCAFFEKIFIYLHVIIL
jgi:hypothetical protein